MPHSLLTDRKMFDQLPQGTLLLDPDGFVVAANVAACRILSAAEDQLIGQSVAEATSFAVFGRDIGLRETLEQFAAQRQVEVERQDDEVPLVVELGPYCDDAGDCSGYLVSFREVPVIHEMANRLQRKQAIIQAEMERSRALVNSIADGIYTIDNEMRITGFSRSLERMTGYAEEEVLGARCKDVLQTNVCETDCPLRWTLENEQPIQNCRATLAGREGESLPAFISSELLRDSEGQVSGCIGIVRDRSEVEQLKKRLGDSLSFSDFVGKSKAMVELFELADNVASTDATVLIQGESGTGKEIMARAIHYRSERRKQPFVRVNCAALTDSLLESELFGHEKGAFTGAIRDKPGRFELADGGTLFLDEIGDTSVALQAKLLRALQEREFERVGGVKTLKADVRVIAASNKDLRNEVARGRFREDLYYRLCVVPLHLPPLRARKEDIPLLVEAFIEKFNAREERIQEVSTRAMALMMDYDWPGNVRELENAVEHAYVTSTTGRIERRFLPVALQGGLVTEIAETGDRRSDAEADLLLVLEQCRWQKSLAAKRLGISRTTLWRRMKDAGLL